jgi:hypothetical protein
MQFATGYTINGSDIMKEFPIKKLKTTTSQCEEVVHNRHKEKLAEEIWKANVAMVLDDVIENSDTFVLPTRSRSSEIYMKEVKDENFKKARRKRKWKDVDFLASNFTGAQMMFRYQNAGVFKEKPIYVDTPRRKKIAARLNAGKSYYG